MNEIFDSLYHLNVNEHTEQKKTGNGVSLTYLSWAWAYAEIVKQCPNMKYEIRHWDGKPYLYDENLGYMVETSITIDGETKTMWLPVMNGANKAMKDKPYTYEVRNYRTGGTEQKTVEAATMFDINTSIMRCLVKNMAMFGLGLYIYAGEDLPNTDKDCADGDITMITKAQIKLLNDLGTDWEKALQYLEVESIDQITEQQADAMIKAKLKQKGKADA